MKKEKSQINYILKYLAQSFLPTVLVFVGGLGAIYALGTGQGGKPLVALTLLMLLVGTSMLAFEQLKKTEFFERIFGKMIKKRKLKGKRMGKRCPKCNKMIYHKRTVCQYCGYEFPSKQYKEEQQRLKEEHARSETLAGKKESGG